MVNKLFVIRNLNIHPYISTCIHIQTHRRTRALLQPPPPTHTHIYRIPSTLTPTPTELATQLVGFNNNEYTHLNCYYITKFVISYMVCRCFTLFSHRSHHEPTCSCRSLSRFVSICLETTNIFSPVCTTSSALGTLRPFSGKTSMLCIAKTAEEFRMRALVAEHVPYVVCPPASVRQTDVVDFPAFFC